MKKKEIRNPKQQRAIETKKQVMDAGIKLFSDNGYYKTTTKQIAKQAGVAIGSFYAYFKDKHELFLEILRYSFGEQTDEFFYNAKRLFRSVDVKKEIISEELKEKIKIIIEDILNMHNKISPGFHREIEIMEYSDPEIKKIKQQHKEQELKISYELLKMFKSKIKRTDIKLASLMLVRIVEDTAHFITYSDNEYDKNKIINEVSDLLYNYLFC